MLISVATQHEGAELQALQSQRLLLLPTASMRRGGSPPVIVGDGIAVFNHPDWTEAAAREFAAMRGFNEPLDVDVPDGFLDSLPIRRLGSNRGTFNRG
jgi:hypothetical protein